MEDLKRRLRKIEEMVTTLYEEQSEATNSIVLEKTMDSTGRVTIPKTFRTALGIENETAEIQMELVGKEIILTVKEDESESVGD